jgi:DNA-binding FadR family transcriptional regulator
MSLTRAVDGGLGSPEPTSDVNRLNLSQRIADHLQQQILSGELTPQTRLPAETELAGQLGVSRTAVRDAMRTLAMRGLVTVRHGHGTAVATPSDAAFTEAMVLLLLRSDLTVGDLIAARAQVDIEIGSSAAERRTTKNCEHLASCIAKFRDAISDQRWRDAELQHVRVHLALLAATQYPALDILLRPMQQVILLSSHPPHADDAHYWELDAHAAILEQLRVGDRQALRSSLLAHYQAMADEEYEIQRAGLVRDSPAMHSLLAAVLEHGLPKPALRSVQRVGDRKGTAETSGHRPHNYARSKRTRL